jgi:hypothetical protein
VDEPGAARQSAARAALFGTLTAMAATKNAQTPVIGTDREIWFGMIRLRSQ